jgi:Family of unknown function (DUF6495)
MKYRRLTLEEFSTLEMQFVQYLAVNSITSADWVKIKNTQTDRMNQLLDEFSDIVWTSVIEKARFLVAVNQLQILFVECLKDKFVIMGINAIAAVDFRAYSTLQEAIINFPEGEKMEVFTITKKYNKAKDLEIFDLILSGCKISDEATFEEIKILVQNREQ